MKALGEQTSVQVSLVISLLIVAFFIGKLSSRIDAVESAHAALIQDRLDKTAKYTENLLEINNRLSRIEGHLGIKGE